MKNHMTDGDYSNNTIKGVYMHNFDPMTINNIKFVSLNKLHGFLMVDRFDKDVQKLSTSEYIQRLMDNIDKEII